ncbi:hypothetical protein TYRP_008952 [Tyrophagus putrescentiae]|nr:hypothetical protein TYRP_008952 [Tyrophagus putrescentiae]
MHNSTELAALLINHHHHHHLVAGQQNPPCWDLMMGCNRILEDYLSLSTLKSPVIHWPQNASAMSTFCTKLALFRSCFEHHLNPENGPNSCSAEERHLYSQFVAVQKNYFKGVCISEKRRADALTRMAQCYSLPEVNAGIIRTGYRAFKMISVEQGSVSSEDKAKAKCCAALYLRDEIYQVNQKSCPAEITEEVHHMVQEMVSPVYRQDCGPVATYKKCYETLPLSVQEVFKKAETAEPPFKNF